MIYDKNFLETLIDNGTEESLSLEFKAAGALARQDKITNEISKDVSAFANSAGGIIIYGLREDDKRSATAFDPIDRTLISKEWLEQIIQSKIQPRIEDVRIYPIQISDRDNEVIYLVEVPQSTTAHQASDRKYYKRLNFANEPMYDYEIRDILNRTKHPNISIEFVINHYEDQRNYQLTVYAKNNGMVLANHIVSRITFPSKSLSYEYDHDEYGSGKAILSGDNTVRDRIGQDFGPARYVPVLPGLFFNLSFPDIELNSRYKALNGSILWEVSADNAPRRTGSVFLNDIKVNHN